MTIKVGDTVTWRSGKSNPKNKLKRVEPLGIANCKVLWIGRGRGAFEDETDFARIELPPMFNGEKCHVYLADLEAA